MVSPTTANKFRIRKSGVATFDSIGMPPAMLLLLWTALITGFCVWDYYQMYRAEYANAASVALDNFNKDVVYRRWAASHGGVYVPATQQTPPNPHLVHLPERDVTLPSGKVLTLVNPAYMTRQVHELSVTQDGVRGHITSLNPIRPQNAPDPWEKTTLQLFETGVTEYSSREELDGRPYLRFMRPLKVETGCLACHEHQGYKVGDIRGGLSVAIPWTPHEERLQTYIPKILAAHGAIWLMGMIGIVYSRRRLRHNLDAKEKLFEELQRNEQQLKKSEACFRQMFEDHSAIMLMMDPASGSIEDVNHAATRFYGYSREQMKTMNISDINLLSPEQIGKCRGLATAREENIFIFPHRLSDGSVRNVQVHTTPITHANKTLLYSIIQDVTEQKRAEEELQTSKERFKQLAEIFPETIFEARPDGSVTYVNQHGLDQFRVTEEEFVNGANIFNLIAPEYRQLVGERIREKLQGINHGYLEYKAIRADGSTFDAMGLSVPIMRDGTLKGIRGFVLDISTRKQAEEEMRRLNDEQAIILDNSGVGIAYVRDRRIKWANATFAAICGYSIAEMTDISTSRFYPSQEDYELFGTEAYPALARGETFVKELQMRRKDGTLFPARFSGKAVSTANPSAGSIWILSDETEHKELEIRLQQSHDLLASLSHQIPGMIYQFQQFSDNRWCFPYASDAISAIFEVSPEEVREDASTVFALLHPDDQTEVVESIAASARSLAPWEQEFRVRLPHRGERWLYGNSRPEKLADGSILWYGFMNDITSRKKLEFELKIAKTAAEAANTAKSRFLANMSHEIRTPMNGVLGMTQLLEFTGLTNEQQEYVDLLKVSGKNLLSLINDILDLSKIEADRIELESAEFCLNYCICDVVLMHKSAMFEKGVRLEIDVAADIPGILLGDQLRIKQILLNLLGNAVKFTHEGSITISAHLLEHLNDSVIVQIAVRDTGIGISKSAHDKIFKPFVQEDSSTTRQFGGSGLGLTISRRLADLMKGTISVESTPGAGSCFTVTLPFSTTGNPDRRLQSGLNEILDWDGPQLQVLLVEDNAINSAFGKSLLKKMGHNVTVVENGQECLDALERSRFDLILMDIQMPVMNGETALQEIRRRETAISRHQPVIALTAYALRGEKEMFLTGGFDGYVSKPLTVTELMREMMRVMGLTPPTP
jgi:PAS domain S-box-containing protein